MCLQARLQVTMSESSGPVVSLGKEDRLDTLSSLSITKSRGQVSLHSGTHDLQIVMMGFQLLGLDSRSAIRRATEPEVSDDGVYKHGIGWSKGDIMKLSKLGGIEMPSSFETDRSVWGSMLLNRISDLRQAMKYSLTSVPSGLIYIHKNAKHDRAKAGLVNWSSQSRSKQSTRKIVEKRRDMKWCNDANAAIERFHEVKADQQIMLPYPHFICAGPHVDESSILLYAGIVKMLRVDTVENVLHSAAYYVDIALRELRPRPGVGGMAGWIKNEWFLTAGPRCVPHSVYACMSISSPNADSRMASPLVQVIHRRRRDRRRQAVHHDGPTFAAVRWDSRGHPHPHRQGLSADGGGGGAGPAGL